MLIFIGPERYMTEEYMDLAIDYAADAFAGVRAIKSWHPLLRPIVAPFLPEIRRAREQTEGMRRWLSPVIHVRIEAQTKPGYQKPVDMAKIQLSLAMAAIHTTSMGVTHMYVFMAMPN